MNLLRQRIFNLSSCVALCVVASIQMAVAAPIYQTDSKIVSGDDRAHLANYVAWRSDCTTKPLMIEMLDPPAHGTVSQEVGLVPIEGVVTGSLDGCLGQEVDGIILYYRADEGFTGEDVFRFRYRYVEPDDEPVILTFTVRVE